jgi:sulfhydrogenase subunit beta (sulfur reductase)
MKTQSYYLDHPNTLRNHLAKSYQIEPPEADSAKSTPPLISPKGQLFAEHENLFTFDGECFRETLPKPTPFVLFGVQSCDLTAIHYQDQFFANDPYYQARRQQALLIGLDCLSPCQQGFCPSVDAGPGVKNETADMILHQLSATSWLLLVCNKKGLNALDGLLLNPANESEFTDRDNRIASCIEQFNDDSYLHQGITAINQNQVPEELWQQLGFQCLSCSGCTTLCPTCSCYGTWERQDSNGDIRRQRFWDSCLYQSFQREASQHNPTEEAGERVKRFWTHKFGDNFAQEFGRYGCVGCGRCEQTCPGVVGVHSVMKRIASDAKLDT